MPSIRLIVFGVIVAAAVVGFTASIYLLMVNQQNRPSETYMIDMMGRMMGRPSPTAQPMEPEVPFYLLALPLIFLGALVFGIVGLVYSLLVPEIKPSKLSTHDTQRLLTGGLSEGSFPAIIKTMKPDEARVLDVLALHGGKYLQKYVAKEAGLSRLKTHRIVVRLVERGIVTVKPFGNTKEVTLAEWLMTEEGAKKKEEPPLKGSP